MYTSEMARGFRSLDSHAPKGFSLSIEDNDSFLTVRADEKQFMSLLDEDKRRAVEYMSKVKKAFEDNGAIVLLVRDGGTEL
jgi:hypothetical protein|tara:strand:- start:413 stop:655 length:243 start_codon:yes stop_codon:yes gene_type:complete